MRFVRMRNDSTGAHAEVAVDAVAHHERLGWVPEGGPRSYVEAVAEQAAREDEAATEAVAAPAVLDKTRKTPVARVTTNAADSGQNGE